MAVRSRPVSSRDRILKSVAPITVAAREAVVMAVLSSAPGLSVYVA